jgi:hypothetical protein
VHRLTILSYSNYTFFFNNLRYLAQLFFHIFLFYVSIFELWMLKVSVVYVLYKLFIEQSHAGIKISPHDNNYVGLHDSLVTVTGTFDNQMQAIDIILRKLSEDVHYPPNLSSPFPYAGKSYLLWWTCVMGSRISTLGTGLGDLYYPSNNIHPYLKKKNEVIMRGRPFSYQ